VPLREAMPLTFAEIMEEKTQAQADPEHASMMQIIEATARNKEKVDDTLTERGKKYGPFTGHAEITQDLKYVITDAMRTRGKSLAYDQQEALDMICHKIGRIINGDPNYDDSWRDIAGYAMLVCNRLTGEGPK
jgi:hypothetical protein